MTISFILIMEKKYENKKYLILFQFLYLGFKIHWS